MVARARTTPLSAQHKRLLEDLKIVIRDYAIEVDDFMKNQWQQFVQKIKI